MKPWTASSPTPSSSPCSSRKRWPGLESVLLNASSQGVEDRAHAALVSAADCPHGSALSFIGDATAEMFVEELPCHLYGDVEGVGRGQAVSSMDQLVTAFDEHQQRLGLDTREAIGQIFSQPESLLLKFNSERDIPRELVWHLTIQVPWKINGKQKGDFVMERRFKTLPLLLLAVCVVFGTAAATAQLGQEVAVLNHLQDGEEFLVSLEELKDHGELLFEAVWTGQEGGGRPLTKGVGAPLSDPGSPLLFPRNFNRVSAPDANSCFGCHNGPRSGGGGDITANVFVLGQRFDFATFDNDAIPTRGAVDENGNPVQLQTIANSRNTLGMFGSGFIEMLARQITGDLQAIRDAIPVPGSAALTSKGISYGTLVRNLDDSWDTSGVVGLPFPSIDSSGPGDPPNLVVRPFHQAGAVISIRQFTNNAFNHHHGIQTTERFGLGNDPDGDGFVDEMTRADVTAAAVWQAQLAVPGRVIPNDPEIEEAVLLGEAKFVEIGCVSCHIPALPLDDEGWIFTEPNPFNPPGNLQPGDAPALAVDLTSKKLDPPRLQVDKHTGAVWVPAFTDLKLHDITTGPADPNCEALDMLHPAGSPEFFAGNCNFLTRKLWGIANEPPFFHHGKFTTMREAIESHRGEAMAAYLGWQALSADERNAVIEFLKTLQVLPEGTKFLVVDEKGNNKPWP